ncbi:MAG: prepilin-type N-terminal cleavage/methylation domain-containing protein [Puniceicoccales bacterium]|jgi:prepilin-type N-terminal cleavage/methylation domain-containing protein|nr:prepilin-type N-terminal cleavage/methylation domain-containing protein [Puniceicoccales bacterium]
MSVFRTSAPRHRSAFTLVEILLVVAIIAVLMALVAGAAMQVIRAAKKQKTVTMYSQWATALDSYKSSYGGYPNLGSGYNSAGDSSYLLDQSEVVENFVRALSARNIDGNELSDEQRKSLNRRLKNFCTFPNENYKDGNPENKLFTDHMDNTKIHIVLDTDSKPGIVLQDQDMPEDPEPLKLQDGNRLNASIYIATLKKDGGDGGDFEDVIYFK